MAAASSGRATCQGTAGIQGQRRTAVGDAVEIATADRPKACVEIRRHGFGLQDGDRRWPQMGVQRVAQLAAVPVRGEVDMRDLAAGMHAGIGAPGAADRRRLARQPLDRGFQFALHRSIVRLPLPARIGAPVIFNR
jgi:hypothetical protein